MKHCKHMLAITLILVDWRWWKWLSPAEWQCLSYVHRSLAISLTAIQRSFIAVSCRVLMTGSSAMQISGLERGSDLSLHYVSGQCFRRHPQILYTSTSLFNWYSSHLLFMAALCFQDCFSFSALTTTFSWLNNLN